MTPQRSAPHAHFGGCERSGNEREHDVDGLGKHPETKTIFGLQGVLMSRTTVNTWRNAQEQS